MNLLKTYHRTKLNPELLNHGKDSFTDDLKDYLRGTITDILPKGKIVGVYFIPYVKKLDTWTAIDYQNAEAPSNVPAGIPNGVPQDIAFICSHTDIRIEDTRGHLITEPTDLKDYERKNWNSKGYKEVEFECESNEQITINYEAMGDAFPPCGEFIFVIDAEKIC